MKSGLPLGSIVLMLLGGIVLAMAQTANTTVTGAALDLTPQQRTAIYQAVTREKLRTPPPAGLPVTVGAQIPPATELYTLPDGILADAPSTKFFKYTVAQNQVVIVDPTNLRVVDVIRQ